MFSLLRPANAAVRAGGWECKSYVCISCQIYTPTLPSSPRRGRKRCRFTCLIVTAGWPSLHHGRSCLVLLSDRSMTSSWSASAVLWLCFLDWPTESPLERRTGPLSLFASPQTSRSMSRLCTGLYGALRGSCETYLPIPQQIRRLSEVIPEADFTFRSAPSSFFLVFILFLVPLSI